MSSNAEQVDTFAEECYTRSLIEECGHLSINVGAAPKCGHDEIDVEFIVIRRCLHRIAREAQSKAVDVDVALARGSLDRIVRMFQQARVFPTTAAAVPSLPPAGVPSPSERRPKGDGGTPTQGGNLRAANADSSLGDSTVVAGSRAAAVAAAAAATAASRANAAVGGPDGGDAAPSTTLVASAKPTFVASLSYAQRRATRAEELVAKRRVAAELEILRRRAFQGAWGTLLTVASNARRNYLLKFSADELAQRSTSLLSAARVLGLHRLARVVCQAPAPTITIRSLPLPSRYPTVTENTPPPPGAVGYLTSRRVNVLATASSTWGPCHASAIVDPRMSGFMTEDVPESCITIDFGGALVIPTAYGFSSIHQILPGYFPRSWDLFGSVDCSEWVLVDSRQESETQHFTGRAPSAVWQVAPGSTATPPFGFLRLVQRGPNSFGSHELQVSSFEVYGSVLLSELDGGCGAPLESPRPERPSGFAPLSPAPDPALLLKKPGKRAK